MALYLSIHLSISTTVYPSIYLSIIYPSIYLCFLVCYFCPTHICCILIPFSLYKFYAVVLYIYLWPFSKSKFNLKSDCVNLVALPSPIVCLPVFASFTCWPGGTVQTGTRLGNSNVLRLPLIYIKTLLEETSTFTTLQL